MVSNGDISTAVLKIFGTFKFESLSDLGSCLVVRLIAYGVFALQHLLGDVFNPMHGGLPGLLGFFLLPGLYLLYVYLKYIVAFRWTFWWSILCMATTTLLSSATAIIQSGLIPKVLNLALAIFTQVLRRTIARLLAIPPAIISTAASFIPKKPVPYGANGTYWENDPRYIRECEEDERRDHEDYENHLRLMKEIGIAWKAFWDKEKAKGDHGMHIGPLERKYD